MNLVPVKSPPKAWLEAIKAVVRCDLLKIPHHGSNRIPRSLPLAFSPAPQYAISTYESKTSRTFNIEGRQVGSPIESLLRPPGNIGTNFI